VRSRIIVIALAVIAVAIAFRASGSDDGSGGDGRASGGGRPGGAVAARAIRLSFVVSPEKQDLMLALVERFNGQRRTSDGRPVHVDVRGMASGEAQAKIAAGRLKPVLWSPASSFWGRLVNLEADRRLVADDNPSIVRTPLVIAMWERLAKAYGHPRRAIGYAELSRLATEGWSAVGRPQFGPFKYVHTNPDFSTSGLSAVAASYYAAVGKKEGLTEADVARGRRQVRRLERSIVHYGDTTLFIAEQMRRRGLGYASAAAMEETTLIAFNRRAADGERLVALYPREGTFFSDNPLITLQGPWVSAGQRRAAKVFAGFLAEAVTAEVAGREGFRPADPDAAPAGLVSAAHGVDPEQPARVLRLPEPKVLARIKAAWRADRKPANVLVVFDVSASMGEEGKLQQAVAGLQGFFREAGDRDRVGLTTFSTEITPLVPIAPMRTNRERLRRAAADLVPVMDTRVRDATVEGVRAVEAALDRDAINAVVLLTDGEDTASTRTFAQAVAELEPQGRKESGQVRVFTIAYGTEPNKRELARFAAVTGGDDYEAGQDDIASIYRRISSFF
jgi:Ca-activated chloride channel family protein